MRAEQQLHDKIGRRDGFRVPEGYFESAYERISDALPEMPRREAPEPLTRWQRLRPYVYMAAMFAGIWLMMKVFTTVTGPAPMNIDNVPENVAIAAASSTPAAFDASVGLENAESDFMLLEDVSSAYSDFDDFEDDFGYELKPQYENIQIPDADIFMPA